MIGWLGVLMLPMGPPGFPQQDSWDVSMMFRFREHGDRGAFGSLLEKYHDKLWYFIRCRVGPQDADDVYQQVAQSLHGYLSRQTPTRFLPLALKTARWRIADYYQQRDQDPEMVPLEEAAGIPDLSRSADDTDLRALRAWFRRVGLEPEQEETLLLHYVAGFSYREIAEISGIGVEGVKSRLRKAREKLRDRADGEVF